MHRSEITLFSLRCPVDAHKVTYAGFRVHSFADLYIYLRGCERCGGFTDPRGIVEMLFPPGQKVELAAVLPGRFD